MGEWTPRTHADLMEDLLNFALEHEWSDDIHAGGDYYEKGCGACGATESVKLKGVPCGEHAPGCDRYRLFEDARAFIRAEREIEEGARPMAEHVRRAAAAGFMVGLSDANWKTLGVDEDALILGEDGGAR